MQPKENISLFWFTSLIANKFVIIWWIYVREKVAISTSIFVYELFHSIWSYELQNFTLIISSNGIQVIRNTHTHTYEYVWYWYYWILHFNTKFIDYVENIFLHYLFYNTFFFLNVGIFVYVCSTNFLNPHNKHMQFSVCES